MALRIRHRYLVAALSVAAACAAQWAWPDISRTQLLLGAIAVTGVWGGRQPGIAAVAMASAARWLWPSAHGVDSMRLFAFVTEGTALVIVIAALYSARERAERRYAIAAGEAEAIKVHAAALHAAKDALAASEQKYRRLFEESRDGILIVARGAIVDANLAARSLLLYDERGLLGRSLADLIVDRDDAFTLTADGVSPRERRTKLRRRDDETVPVWITASGPGMDARGDAFIIRDLTTMLSLEKQMHQAQKMDAVGRLAGGIAHDFNNLLTAITGYTELVIASLPEANRELVEDMNEIRRAALSAARLTKQLLEFSRPQRTRTQVLDMNAIVTRMAGVLRRTLGEDIEMRLTLDPDIKPVKADAGQLEQIVLNLAVNARDAMPQGGRLTLTTAMHESRHEDGTALAQPGDYVRLTVADSGCGISDEIQAHIFEPFFTTKGNAGTGLGLATVYGIVTQTGGHVGLESAVGVGTTFRIDLPTTSDPLDAHDATTAHPCFVNGRGRVLIVEDDPGVRQIAELVLRRAGHEVVAVAGPHEALAALEGASGIDLVLTDVVMPEMNGYDLAAKIRGTVAAPHVVFMSGFANDTRRNDPDNSFLAKPFTAETLTSAVRQAMAAVA